jgi:hypothetical protein
MNTGVDHLDHSRTPHTFLSRFRHAPFVSSVQPTITMAETARAQYQHFVPQFLLRNFSHPYKPQNTDAKKSKRSKRKYAKGMFPGDLVVRNLDLSADPPGICEMPVKRILGKWTCTGTRAVHLPNSSNV